METGLAGKRVLVTGGGGGIGSACVRAFAAEGARVAIHYRTSRDHAKELARETSGVALQADLTVEDEVDSLFEAAERELDGLDVCAAVAGFWPRAEEPVWELPLERWEATLRTNLTATFLTARGFLRVVERTGHGSLVLVGSTAGRFGEAGHADYAAAKAGLTYGLARTVKNEIARLAPRGRVNVVCPGWVVTPMTQEFTADPDRVRRTLQTIPLRKVGRPHDVAAAVLYLASGHLAGHVSGQVLTVAGGMEGRLLYGPDEVDPARA